MSEIFKNPRFTVKFSVYLVVTMSICALLTAGVLYRTTDKISETVDRDLIESLKEQVTLLKWIGGLIITSLVTAVGILYRSLERSNAIIRQDLIETSKAREEILKQVVVSNTSLEGALKSLSEKVDDVYDSCEQCPGRKIEDEKQ